jgi:CRISPR-associated endonuclease Cas1
MSSLLFSLPLLVSVATFQTASANPASEAGAVVSSLTARGGYVDRTNPCAALRVRRGALDIEHGTGEGKRAIRIDVDDAKPHTILFDGHGEFLTGEALRWCARYGIGIILPHGPGRVMTFLHSALEADANGIPDTSPAMIRAQCRADSLSAAREIVRAKIERELEATVQDKATRHLRLAEWETRIGATRTVAELLIVEAKAAADYWRGFADRGLREAKGGNLPRTWLRFANRQKGAGFLGSKNASHPINAMLNYAYVVEAGRLAKALAARGLALQIGYLHSDKTGRNSLVWDAIEPLRPIIDAKVFRYLEGREFKRRDFVQTSASTYRLERDIITELLTKASLPRAEIDDAADFMLRIIERHSGSAALFKADGRKRARALPGLVPGIE